MTKTLKFVLFAATFLAAQKLVPIIFPRGSFSGADYSEWLQWVFGGRTLVIGLLQVAVALVICGLPLSRLPAWMSVALGAALGVSVSLVIYPYDLFEMGVWKHQWSAVAYAFIALSISMPWLVFVRSNRLG